MRLLFISLIVVACCGGCTVYRVESLTLDTKQYGGVEAADCWYTAVLHPIWGSGEEIVTPVSGREVHHGNSPWRVGRKVTLWNNGHPWFKPRAKIWSETRPGGVTK